MQRKNPFSFMRSMTSFRHLTPSRRMVGERKVPDVARKQSSNPHWKWFLGVGAATSVATFFTYTKSVAEEKISISDKIAFLKDPENLISQNDLYHFIINAATKGYMSDLEAIYQLGGFDTRNFLIRDAAVKALENDHIEIAEFLFMHGAPREHPLTEHQGRLWIAAALGNLGEVVLELAGMPSYGDLGKKEFYYGVYVDALSIAAQYGYIEIVSALTNRMRIYSYDDRKKAASIALLAAAKSTSKKQPYYDKTKKMNVDRLHCIRRLISHDADIEYIYRGDSNQLTPLSYAALHGSRDTVMFLLDAGASKQLAIEKLGWSDLTWLVSVGTDSEFTSYLESTTITEDDQRFNQSIEQAVKLKQYERVKLLIEKGAKNTLETSSLAMISAKLGDADALQLLMNTEANLKQQSDWLGALYHAIKHHHFDCVKLILPAISNISESKDLDHLELLKDLTKWRIAPVGDSTIKEYIEKREIDKLIRTYLYPSSTISPPEEKFMQSSHVIKETKGNWDVIRDHFPEVKYVKSPNSKSIIDEIHMTLIPSQLNFTDEEPYSCYHSVTFNIKFYSPLTSQQKELIKSCCTLGLFFGFKDDNSLYIEADFYYRAQHHFERLMTALKTMGGMDEKIVNEIIHNTCNPGSSEFNKKIGKELIHTVELLSSILSSKLEDEEEADDQPRFR